MGTILAQAIVSNRCQAGVQNACKTLVMDMSATVAAATDVMDASATDAAATDALCAEMFGPDDPPSQDELVAQIARLLQSQREGQLAIRQALKILHEATQIGQLADASVGEVVEQIGRAIYVLDPEGEGPGGEDDDMMSDSHE